VRDYTRAAARAGVDTSAREIERQARAKAAKDSLFIGEPKQRLELTLTVQSIFESQGNYGTTFITKLVDADGNLFTWFGSYSLERGATYTGKWTVKAHEDHPQYGKSTIITRPARDLQEVKA
jgi:hypothetical protein